MPVTSTSGIAGAINVGGQGQQPDNSVQQFAELMFRQKDSQVKADQAILSSAAEMAKAGIMLAPEMQRAVSGAQRRMGYADHLEHYGNARQAGASPDMAAAHAAVAAPLPPGTPPIPATGDQGAAAAPQAPWLSGAQQLDPFSVRALLGQQQMGAERALTEAQTGQARGATEAYAATVRAQDAETAVRKQELAEKQNIENLWKIAQGPDKEAAANATFELVARHDATAANLSATQLPIDQKMALIEVNRRNLAGELPEQKKRMLAAEYASKNVDNFGGSLDKANSYYTDILDGKKPSVMPTPSPEYIKANLGSLYQSGVLMSMGIPAGYQAQFLAAGGDISKVPELKGVITHEMLAAKAEMLKANASMIAAQSGAKMVDSEIAKNIATAINYVSEASSRASAGDKNALATIDKIAQITNTAYEAVKNSNGKLDPSFAKGISDQLAPLGLNLAPHEIPGWIYGSTTIFEPMGGVPDHNDANHPQVQQYQSFTPDMLDRYGLPHGLGYSFTQQGAKDIVNQPKKSLSDLLTNPIMPGPFRQQGPPAPAPGRAVAPPVTPQQLNMEQMFGQFLQGIIQNAKKK